MSDLAAAFFWLVVQVTAVGLVAWLLESRLATRCQASASRLIVTAFVGVGCLTILTFIPLPDWWNWQQAGARNPNAVDVASINPGQANEQEALAADAASSGRWFTINLARFVPTAIQERSLTERAGRLIVAIWLAGVILALLRLLVGFLSIQWIRRRSNPVADARVFHALASLQSKMGQTRRIELREADLPGLPATVGWLRPMILLPLDWRAWSDSQLHSALAHELAHIQSADFFASIVARVGLSLHFYHPMMRWLLKRLQLRQELAADAVASRLAGGSHEYLRAMAALALRSQSRCPDAPARLFLSAHGGAWFRRVQMLRNAKEARPVSRTVRGLALALMVCSAAIISAVRGPAQTPKPAAQPPNVENQLEPFDLSYFSRENAPHLHALIAVRPSVLLALPGMDSFRKQNDLGLAELAKMQGGSLPEDFSLTDVDQIIAEVRFDSKGTGEPGSRSVMIGSDCFMIRMRKEMDWGKFLKTVFVNVKSESVGAGTIYTIKLAPLPTPMRLYAPDNRTLIPATEKDGKLVAPVAKEKATPWNFGPAWKQVERAHFAYFYDNRDHWWSKKLAPELKAVEPAVKLVSAAESACAGVWFSEGIQAKLFIQGKTDADAKACQESLNAICKHFAQTPASNDEDQPIAKLLRGLLLKAGQFERQSLQVKAEASVNVRLADLVQKLEAKAESTDK